jgi:TetR/AcrR family transcriptional repressor of mexJK operon
VPNSVSSSRVGRPKDLAKRAAIVDAANSLFAEQHYELVTMEDVAARAGVSKMTVYSHFSDKDTLFENVVSDIADRMMQSVLAAGSAQVSLRQRLTVIGVSFLTIVSGVQVAGLAHTLPGALRGNRELRLRFFNAGPGRTSAALAGLISAAVERNELTVDSAKLAAEDLVSLWEGGLPARIVFGVSHPLTQEEIEQRAQRGTDIFLRAYANPRKRKSL